MSDGQVLGDNHSSGRAVSPSLLSQSATGAAAGAHTDSDTDRAVGRCWMAGQPLLSFTQLRTYSDDATAAPVKAARLHFPKKALSAAVVSCLVLSGDEMLVCSPADDAQVGRTFYHNLRGAYRS